VSIDSSDGAARMLADEAHDITGAPSDYDRLIDKLGKARVVLLGEGTHGTHEFYRQRALVTRRLIAEKGFAAVAIEGDWPDAFRVNRYVRALGADRDAEEALRGFRRFPTWMWRNADVVDFVGWLRSYNDEWAPKKAAAGFYGLDVYSLFASADAVISYLEQIDPVAAQRARDHYACFDAYRSDEPSYGFALQSADGRSCEDDVVAVLADLRKRVHADTRGACDAEQSFSAAQNAAVVANAERYYRTMFDPHVSSWNVRDHHMADTIGHLLQHLAASAAAPKIVVWAHNSHVGDARATDMSARREVNIGQLCRQTYGGDCALVGFATYTGTVTAARDWHALAERRMVRPARPESVEGLLHRVGKPSFFVDLGSGLSRRVLDGAYLERAIGVVYRPETELESHYLQARPGRQFDALVFMDQTRAVEPLERTPVWESGELPETFPSGI
jgi:erythromycin esterase-like protein